MDTTIQLAVIIVGALGMSIPFGLYIARMISFELRPLERGLAKVERGFFKLIGIDADRQMTWKEYFLALFMTSIISIIFVILVLSFQNIYDYQSMSTDYPQIWHLILPCQLSQIPWWQQVIVNNIRMSSHNNFSWQKNRQESTFQLSKSWRKKVVCLVMLMGTI